MRARTAPIGPPAKCRPAVADVPTVRDHHQPQRPVHRRPHQPRRSHRLAPWQSGARRIGAPTGQSGGTAVPDARHGRRRPDFQGSGVASRPANPKPRFGGTPSRQTGNNLASIAVKSDNRSSGDTFRSRCDSALIRMRTCTRTSIGMLTRRQTLCQDFQVSATRLDAPVQCLFRVQAES